MLIYQKKKKNGTHLRNHPKIPVAVKIYLNLLKTYILPQVPPFNLYGNTA